MSSHSLSSRTSWTTAAGIGLIAFGVCGTSSCSGSDTGSTSSSSGGNASVLGGSNSQGGTSTTGGTAASAGAAQGGGAQGGTSGSRGVGTGGMNGALGGAIATGGMASIGASPATGGNATTGGLASVGGTKASGGTGATGGSKTNGGSTSSAGALATGGATPTGGTPAVGGGNTGGSKATGGSVASGGSRTTGGSAATGGSKAIGGVAATGGTRATGGSSTGSNTPITVWSAGDSTMQPCTTACPCGWGSQFDPYFNSNVTVNNSAVGGRSIQTWLYEGAVSSTLTNGDCELTSTAYASRWTNMLNSMKAGDYLFIEFGINDGDSTCPRHVSSARFQTLLGVMAQAAKDKGATPIFLTSTAAISCSGSVAQKNRGFITETNAAAAANSVTVIDLQQLSVNLYNSLGLCPNASDYTSTTSAVGLFFCDDHTHFESAGAKQIAGVVANALRTQGIPLASYLL